MQEFRVYISVGHGGSDPGALGKGENGGLMRESKINLNVAMGVKRRLEARGVTVKMSRENDTVFKSPSLMAREAVTFKATHLLAIHHNAGGGDGWEVLCQENPASKKWAALVGEQFKGLNNAHGAKPIYVSGRDLGIMKTRVKTILTEAFFLDTPDIQFIWTLGGQEKEANAIAYATLQDMGIIT